MSQPNIHLHIYIDYLCPYVHRSIEWIATLRQAGVDLPPLRWRHFSLVQVNHRLRDGWHIWELPSGDPAWQEHDAARSLRYFWAADAARRQGDAAFLRFQLALTRAIHVDKTPPNSWGELETVAHQADLELHRFVVDYRDPGALHRLAEDHNAGVAQSVFGTPTFAFGDAVPMYIKLARVLDAQEAQTAWTEFGTIAQARPYIIEMKRPH